MYNNTTRPLDYNIICLPHKRSTAVIGRFDVSDDRSVERMNDIILDVYIGILL